MGSAPVKLRNVEGEEGGYCLTRSALRGREALPGASARQKGEVDFLKNNYF